MAAAIFRAKFTVPSLPADYRPRPRLDRCWRQPRPPRLITVTAGAGWGKTCFLASRAHELADQALWYTLDDLDRDPSVLAAHLTTACGLPLTDGPPLEQLAGIIGAMDRRQLLVLDDVQAITDSETARQFLGRLLRYLPASCGLALSSREPVVLAAARLETRGEALHLSAVDLSLTPSESREILVRRCGRAAETLADRVHALTEGWPTALEIVCQALAEVDTAEKAARQQAVLDRLEAGGSRWFDFFAEEILADLDPRTRDFMLRTSLLPHLEAELCDRLLERRGSARLLRTLAERNLFTVPVGDGCWRYHNLLRSCLRRRLAHDLTPARWRRLHRRAAAVLVEAGEPEAAILDLARAGDVDQAVALLSRHARWLADSRRPETLRCALAALPDDAIRTQAGALVVRASQAHLCGRWQDAEDDLRRASRLRPPADLASQLQARLVRLHLQRGHFEQCLRSGRRVLAGPRRLAPEDRGLILSSLGVAAASLGRLKQGEEFLQEALAGARRREDRTLEGRCLYLLAANVHYIRGDLDRALATARHARDLYQELGRGDLACHAEGVLGFVLAGRGDAAAARASSNWALQHAEAIGYRLVAGYARLTLGECELLSDDPPAAAARFGEACAIAGELGEEALESWCRLGLGEAAWRRQDLAGARREIQRALAVAQRRGDLFCQARALAQRGRLEAVDHDPAARRSWQVAERLLARLGADLERWRLRLWRAAAGDEDPAQVLARLAESAPAFLLDRLEAEADRRLGEAPGTVVDPTATEHSASGLTALHLRVLGPLEVVHGETELDPGVWRSRRARRLLNLLVVRYPRPVPREQAMEAMWPGADPGKAAVSLRQAVFQLRNVLQQDHVLTEGETLRLELGPDGSCDAEVFTGRLARARGARRLGDREGELAALQEAVALWRGPLLADTPYDGEVEEPAAALRLDFLRAAERLLELLAAAGKWDDLVIVARRALDEDPLHEPFARALLLGLLRLGHRQDVVDTYARFESRLVRELDLLPSARLKELAEQASGHDHSPMP